VLKAERSSYRYRCRRGDQADLEKRIKEIAEARVRYGYRPIHVLLVREGWRVNGKRVCRLYRELGLQLHWKFQLIGLVANHVAGWVQSPL